MERQDTAPTSGRTGLWDGVAVELQLLRRAAGDPSYAQIARRVSRRREAVGATPEAARVARTTVYDAFRTGRTRVDVGLKREIAHSLGADDATVDGWLGLRDEVIVPAEAALDAPTRRQVAVLMVGGVALSLLGRLLVDGLGLPVHLDMVGTAIAAIALGPWRGAAVGAATNVIGVFVGSGLASLSFLLVNIAGGLVWGYGVRRLDLGRTLPRFFGLNMLVAVVCSGIAVPVILGSGGSVGRHQDPITASVHSVVPLEPMAVGLANLLISVGDKLISGFVALVVISMLPVALRAGLRLVLTTPAAD